MSKTSDPLLIVKLQKGLADRKRLPLAHVIGVLDELRQLIAEIGKDLQHKRGMANANGDFGLELVAGEKGIAFQAGSVQASIVLTERVGLGYKAIQSVIETVGLLEQEDFAAGSADQQIDRRIIRRLSRIAHIQKSDRVEMNLSIHKPGRQKPIAATFGSNGMAVVRSLQAPTFRVEDMVLYGKLFQLIDRSSDENEEEKGFWGELAADGGETWRVQFRVVDVEMASSLFRKQVKVSGAAVHYRIAHPKIVCDKIELDKDRDTDAAFDELFGCKREIYKTDLQTLLKGIHGEE